MAKKMTALLLSMCLVFSLIIPASAAEDSSAFSGEFSLPQEMTGVLSSNTGETYIIHGTLISQSMEQRMLSDDCSTSATYAFNIPSSIMRIGPISVDLSSPDSGYESTVYLSIKYRYNKGTRINSYLLENVSGRWEIANPSRTSVESAYLSYKCVGPTDENYVSNANWSQAVFDLSVTNNFNVSTNFSEYVFPI